MKNAADPRHQARRSLVQQLFTLSFDDNQTKNLAKTNPRLKKIIANKTEIDRIIQKAAPQFPVERLNRIDLAILRLAVFELVFAKKEPPKVIVDEAIELAKEFGAEKSPQFINGALGKILDDKIGKI